MEDTTQDTTIEKQEMVSENDFVVHSDIKVENEDRSKLVFGRSGGGAALYSPFLTGESHKHNAEWSKEHFRMFGIQGNYQYLPLEEKRKITSRIQNRRLPYAKM